MFIYPYRIWGYYTQINFQNVINDANSNRHGKMWKNQRLPREGLCIKVCEQGALIEEDGEIVLVPENCDDCDICIQSCPNQAISKKT
jgi:MinD superfamily P-loop ATPase